jgi:hypothetical protein
MRLRLLLLLVALCAGVISGCVSTRPQKGMTPVVPYGVGGLIYTNYKAPLATDFDRTPAKPTKVGKAHTTWIYIPFFLPINFAFGEAGVADAAKNGNITEVCYADYEFTRVLFFFASYETIVHGN